MCASSCGCRDASPGTSLILQDLSFAEWGMITGGIMILVAAGFESRKATFVRERFEDLKTRMKSAFEAWK